LARALKLEGAFSWLCTLKLEGALSWLCTLKLDCVALALQRLLWFGKVYCLKNKKITPSLRDPTLTPQLAIARGDALEEWEKWAEKRYFDKEVGHPLPSHPGMDDDLIKYKAWQVGYT